MQTLTQIPEVQTTTYYRVTKDNHTTYHSSDYGPCRNGESYGYEQACAHAEQIKNHIYQGKFINKDADIKVEAITAVTTIYRPVLKIRVAEMYVKQYLCDIYLRGAHNALPPEYYILTCEQLDNVDEFFMLLRLTLQQPEYMGIPSEDILQAIKDTRAFLTVHFPAIVNFTDLDYEMDIFVISKEWKSRGKRSILFKRMCSQAYSAMRKAGKSAVDKPLNCPI